MNKNLLGFFIACVIFKGSFAQHHFHASGNPPKLPVEISVFTFSHSLFKSYPFSLTNDGSLQAVTNNGSAYSATGKKGKLHGSWQSSYANGQLLDQGHLIKGVPNGEWKVWNAAGQLIALRTYNADLFHRVKREVELNHPKNYSFAITARYKKEGRDAVKFLQAGSSFIQQRALRTSDIADLVHINSTDMLHYHPAFNDCLHHGLYMNYFENGIAKDSGHYKEGLRDGVWIHRTTEGTWKGAYKNGIRYNEWKLYNAMGKLSLIIFYNKQGKETGRKKMGLS
ncbi:hypothetical protein ESA94_20040 [Lacibacter luteus]|uniref:Toxin-antitoxin system YwqK family antitoxin n=1 Tax=Lacibacter luteus TaxID=2508719 RepID=A0A4Q1CEC0_9BACT|nr:hypothetical protein [Lacibacter luteus]RXK57812.1 hypothetical protein ESA94_20040 [Lacibacter luteus]